MAYEYAALESAFNVVSRATATPPLIAALDSFLVYYRSLVEFFHTGKDWRIRYPDNDIRAEHYIPGWTTPTFNEWGEMERGYAHPACAPIHQGDQSQNRD